MTPGPILKIPASRSHRPGWWLPVLVVGGCLTLFWGLTVVGGFLDPSRGVVRQLAGDGVHVATQWIAKLWLGDINSDSGADQQTSSPEALLNRPLPMWAPVHSSSWLAAWLDVGEQPVRVNDLVVLPGDDAIRPVFAAAMYREGLADRILVPRNPSPVGASWSESGSVNADQIKALLMACGVPEKDISLLPGWSHGTIGDARCTQAEQGLPEYRKLGVVTSFYHTRRARLAFRSVTSPASSGLRIFSVPASHFSPDDWWMRSAGRHQILSETVKLPVYWFCYGDGRYLVVVLGLATAWLLRRRKVIPVASVMKFPVKTEGQSPVSRAA